MKYKENDILVGLENFSNLHSFFSYKINKYVSVQANLEISPSSVLNRNFKGFVNKFGVGFHFNSHSQEDLLSHEEDFSNFNYDQYLS